MKVNTGTQQVLVYLQKIFYDNMPGDIQHKSRNKKKAASIQEEMLRDTQSED